MRFSKKNFLLKSVAVTACLGIISLSFPVVAHASEKKANRPGSSIFLEKSMLYLQSILPIFVPIFDTNEKSPQLLKDTESSSGKIKILDNATSKRKANGKD